MSEKRVDRRGFLAGSAAAAVAVVPRHVLGGVGNTPPSERLNIAGIVIIWLTVSFLVPAIGLV